MCGIVGYVGDRPAVPILIDGLRRLEYRGYDSAGVAVVGDRDVAICKTRGRLEALEAKLPPFAGGAGIGHTRWATHGPPSDRNAHPHQDCTGRFAVIHNGIIENYLSLKEWLAQRGHRFRSDTDTEVIAHLVEEHYAGDLEAAVRAAVARARGAYALAIMCRDEPDRLVAVRLTSPLVIGLGEGENFLASDVPALLPYTRRVIFLDDGEMAVLTRAGVRVTTIDGRAVSKPVVSVTWDVEMAQKGGYPHFMLKEIHEQPKAIADTLTGRISAAGDAVLFEDLKLTRAELAAFDRLAVVACGTAAHAGLVGKHLIERWARLPVEWEIASEFRYRQPLVDARTLTVLISQSGETADTLAALREAKRLGSPTLAITNVVGSSIAREADHVLHTWAGPEIAVASTKAYTTQLVLLTLLAVHLGQVRGRLALDEARLLLDELRTLPRKAEEALRGAAATAALAAELAGHEDCFFIGRGLDYAVAVEGQLKLKEISYIHAEAYPAGELKHGTLALITEGVPVVAIATQEELLPKTVSNVIEVQARGARVIAIGMEGGGIGAHADALVEIPRVHPALAPALAVIPCQLLAYSAAVARGADVDKPRNLAKSVTVE